MTRQQVPEFELIREACVPRKGSHLGGTLENANALLHRNPELGGKSIFTAAALADEGAIQSFLSADPSLAHQKGGPYAWDALTHLCFSRYLRLDKDRSAAFVRSAKMLLDHGANPNTGFTEVGDYPGFECVLYGAAGVAQHPGVTEVLMQYGADPNDEGEEVSYHTPESYDNTALEIIVRSGKVNANNLAAMLLRKCDWHDRAGVNYLVQHGANPNLITRWGFTALHQSIRRDNDMAIIQCLLDHQGDPAIKTKPANFFERSMTGISIAARRGRGDVLAAIESKGMSLNLAGVECLLAFCAKHDAKGAKDFLMSEPGTAKKLASHGGTFLNEFAGVGNAEGVKILLDLGVPVNSLYIHGDGYFDVAPMSTALHVAAWRGRSSSVKALIEGGADINMLDGKGRTAIELAVKACVNSYWKDRRSPDSVKALVDAGARLDSLRNQIPCGYEAVDNLLLTLLS